MNKQEFLFICYPRCGTCKKAQAWLDASGIKYTLRDIKINNPTIDELRAWQQTSNLPLKRFFNTSGLVYKNLGLAQKLADMNESEQLEILASDGMLVKRPILVGNTIVLVGFKQAEWEKLL